MTHDRVLQTDEELQQQLAEQIQFLRTSCESFDRGNELEAKRLAVPLRVLLYDGGRSKSLLGQLGIKTIGFFDGAGDFVPGNLTTEWTLVRMYASSGPDSRFLPLLDDSPIGEGRPIGFGRWWTKPVFRDTDRAELSRKDIVLAVANQRRRSACRIGP